MTLLPCNGSAPFQKSVHNPGVYIQGLKMPSISTSALK